MKRRPLIILAIATLPALASLEAHATCQNMQNQTINLGIGRMGLRGPSDFFPFADVFTSGDGWQNSAEPNLGLNKTLGYLPPGAVYNAWFTTAVIDNSVADCMNARIEVVLTAMNGDNCASTQAGPWTTSYNVNTCSLADGVFRGIVQIGHNTLGFAPSYMFQMKTYDFTRAPAQQTLASGCHKVTTQGGASGCSDPI
jgi:hypothetical protein